jgi:signal peptidase I
MEPWEQREADRQLLELSTTQPLPTIQKPSSTTQWFSLKQSTAQLRGEQYIVREMLEMIMFVILLFFLVRGVVQNFLIEGMSMEPTLHTNEYILVNKLAYLHFDLNAPQRLLGNEDVPAQIIFPFGGPTYGDIIVFEYPNNITTDYIKRVVGLPGDEVVVRDGVVFVNGRQLAEPYLGGAPTYCYASEVCANDAVIVPADHVFVMGDNRENSSDSREWGALSYERVIGRAWFVYWPFEYLGPIEHFDSLLAQP